MIHHNPLLGWLRCRLIPLGVLSLSILMLVFVTASASAQATPAGTEAISLASWSGWREVPGGGATPDAPAAANYRGSQYVFVRGTDDRIYVNTLTGTAWSGWREVPGGGATLAGPGAATFGGALYLFVQGTDNRIYLNALTGTAWSGW